MLNALNSFGFIGFLRENGKLSQRMQTVRLACWLRKMEVALYYLHVCVLLHPTWSHASCYLDDSWINSGRVTIAFVEDVPALWTV